LDIFNQPVNGFIKTPQGSLLIKWKLLGAIYVSAIGCLLSFLTVLAHFDTILLPSLWIHVFRDGSLAERNWICFLVIFWAASVHICTSTLSIGELQPNVFFTTWIAFGSIASTFDVWRDSAGLTSSLTSANTSAKKTAFVFSNSNNNNSSNSHQSTYQQGGGSLEMVTSSHNANTIPVNTLSPPILDETDLSFHRETTINWIWTLAFSLLFALSIVDVYYNRDHLVISFDAIQLDHKRWVQVLSTVWADVVVCILAIIINEHTGATTQGSRAVAQPTFSRTRSSSADVKYKYIFGWRQLEGIVLCCASGFKFYIILTYTGVDGVINGLSNAYFGIWGSFFNSIFTFGTWLRENKNTVIREHLGSIEL
jgi:hypothetical protein